MSTYIIRVDENKILRIGFAKPAHNDQIVQDATMQLDKLIKEGDISGGEVIRINGPASLPVAMAVAHALGHLYQAVACFDPKLSKYVVSIAHGDKFKIGDLID